MKDFNWENIGRIFDYLNGYSEGEHTLSFRYLDSVTFSQRDEIIQKVYYNRYIFDYEVVFQYFDEYKSYFGVEKLCELKPDDVKVLAALIFGDVWCRKHSTEVADIYHKAGAPVFKYHLGTIFAQRYLQF